MSAELEGKIAIVTGASRGIGRQFALALAGAGAQVVVAARTVENRRRLPGTIGETLDMIEQAGGKGLAVQADMTNPDDLRRLVDTAVETFGGLDILVNNAADTAGESVPIEEASREAWMKQFDTNVHAPFTLMSLAVPHLKARGGGTIVNITSAAADMREVDLRNERFTARLGAMLGYATTKAALSRLTNAVAPELARDSITVAAIDPGFTRTERVDLLHDKGLIDAGLAHAMDEPVAALMNIVTADDPLTFAGKIVRVRVKTQA